MAMLVLSAWASRPHCQLRSGSQLKIVSTLNVYRSGTRAGAHDRADRRTFTTARNRTNDGTDRGTDSRALHCLVGLVAIANRAFVIDTDHVAIRRTNRFENTGKTVASAVSHS